jgi:hypothetical protein
MADKEIDARQALDRFFSVVREEATSNSRFAARLLDAVGFDVVFRGSEARYAVDPVQIAMKGQEAFRQTFLSFSPAELKAMVKEFNLATQADMKGKTRAPQIVEIMWEGASAKIKDRGLSR